MTINIGSLNVNNRAESKFEYILATCCTLDIILLQETGDLRWQDIERRLNAAGMQGVYSKEARGLITAWGGALAGVRRPKVTLYTWGLSIEFCLPGSAQVLQVFNLYLSTHSEQRCEQIGELDDALEKTPNCLIVGGDFNTILSPLDSANGQAGDNSKASTNAADMLKVICKVHELQDAYRDLNPAGNAYTHYRSTQVPRRLDRILSRCVQPKHAWFGRQDSVSDHVLTGLQVKVQVAATADSTISYKRQLFVPENDAPMIVAPWVPMCLQSSVPVVISWLQETYRKRPAAHTEMSALIEALTMLQEHMTRFAVRPALVHETLFHLQARSPIMLASTGQVSIEPGHIGSLILKLRKHLKFYKEAPRPSYVERIKFFAAKVRDAAGITTLPSYVCSRADNNKKLRGGEAVKEICAHFNDVYRNRQVQYETPLLATVINPDKTNPLMLGEKELQKILSGTTPTAPGPDGLSYAVWKTCVNAAEMLRGIIHQIITKGDKLPANNRAALLILLGKKGISTHTAAGLRPIMLQNTVVKMISLVLKACICHTITELVGPMQYGFTPERRIEHAAERVRQWLNRGAGGVIFADISAAYDSVDRSLLKRVLRKTGMSAEWMQLVNHQLEASTVKVLWGKRIYRQEIQVARGVPQGDPLSPWLFNIFFATVIRHFAEAATAEGIMIDIVLYADDIAIYVQNAAEIPRTLDLLRKSLHQAGLELNAKKTKVIDGRGELLPPYQGVEWVTEFVYLGIPIGQTIPHDIWESKTAKIERTIQVYKGRNGRLLPQEATFVWNIFFASRLNHLAMFYAPTPSQIARLEWAARSLLGIVRRQKGNAKYYFGIAFKKACMPRENGGTGIFCPSRRASAMKGVWFPLLEDNTFFDVTFTALKQKEDAHWVEAAALKQRISAVLNPQVENARCTSIVKTTYINLLEDIKSCPIWCQENEWWASTDTNQWGTLPFTRDMWLLYGHRKIPCEEYFSDRYEVYEFQKCPLCKGSYPFGPTHIMGENGCPALLRLWNAISFTPLKQTALAAGAKLAPELNCSEREQIAVILYGIWSNDKYVTLAAFACRVLFYSKNNRKDVFLELVPPPIKPALSIEGINRALMCIEKWIRKHCGSNTPAKPMPRGPKIELNKLTPPVCRRISAVRPQVVPVLPCSKIVTPTVRIKSFGIPLRPELESTDARPLKMQRTSTVEDNQETGSSCHRTGIRNAGNQCHLISALQLLLSAYTVEQMRGLLGRLPPSPLRDDFIMYFGRDSMLPPTLLLRHMYPGVEGRRQQDAHDTLLGILGMLHPGVNDDQGFGVIVATRTREPATAYDNTITEDLATISVSVCVQPFSIGAAINEYTATARVQRANTEGITLVSKTFMASRRFVIVHLNLFAGQRTVAKRRTNLSWQSSRHLTLHSTTWRCNYFRIGCICHHGDTLAAGHYSYISENGDGTTTLCNDDLARDMSTEATNDYLRTADIYVIMFRRVEHSLQLRPSPEERPEKRQRPP
jgi:exonuclease III